MPIPKTRINTGFWGLSFLQSCSRAESACYLRQHPASVGRSGCERCDQVPAPARAGTLPALWRGAAPCQGKDGSEEPLFRESLFRQIRRSDEEDRADFPARSSFVRMAHLEEVKICHFAQKFFVYTEKTPNVSPDDKIRLILILRNSII